MRDAKLFELVEAIRGAGLNIPDECETIDHIIIALRANPPLGGNGGGGGDEFDDPIDHAGRGKHPLDLYDSGELFSTTEAPGESRPPVTPAQRRQYQYARLLSEGKALPRLG